jgi:hypothetical protein
MAVSFNTLRVARRLREAGASEPMAEAIVEAIGESREFDMSQLATKVDIAALDAKIATTELRLLNWVIGVAVAAVIAIVGALSGVIWTATQIILHARP